jgi:hypothetical protein
MSVPDRSRNRNATNIYDESVHLARQAVSEGKLGPRDVKFGRPRLGSKDNWIRGMSTIMPRSNMSADEYENWVSDRKAEGWTDWKAEKPMSSEDLKQMKQARRKK